MAGTTELPQPKYVDFREYILFQVQRTRSLVRQTDMLLLTSTAIAAVFFTLFLFTLLDHWAFTLGLPVWLRWTGFSSVLGILGASTAIFLRTSAGRQVSSLFAARALERAESKLQNSLLTLVDLDQSDRPSSAAIRSSLEKRAALALNDLDVDHAVDRRPLLHRIYALLLGVLLLFGYAFIAQKSVAESVYRIMLPWTQAAPPTQTKLLDIQPGNVTVSSGTHVEVSTFIDGKTPDKVWVVYSTADERIVNERVELLPTEEGLGKFTGVIAGENGRGVDQQTTYYLAAGDGRSETFTVSVRPAPHVKISGIELTPPTYTGRPPRSQTIGAIDALEGTAVTLRGETNIPVETAWIQLFNSEAAEDRSGQLPLTITDGTKLSGNWTLKIRDDGTYPRFYRIECETSEGDREASPPMHAMIIRPDARPEVQLLAPTSDLERPLNATVPLLIEAFDPDFQLSGLSVQVERQGQLLSSELLDVAGQRKVRVKHALELKRLPLKVGDILSFWVEARDNREPQANRRMTSKLRIRITEPVSEEEAEAQRKEDEAKQEPESAENQPQQNPETEDAPASEQMTPPSEEAADSDGDEGNESQQEGGEGEESKQSGQQSEPGDKESKQKQPGGKKPNGNGDSSEESSNQPGEGDSDQQGEPEFDPDGADDDRVLEKMIEQMQQDGKQPKEGDNSGDNPNPDNPANGENQGNNSPENPDPNDSGDTMPPENTPPGESAEEPNNSEKMNPDDPNGEPGDNPQNGEQPKAEPLPEGDNTPDQNEGTGEQMQPDQQKGTDPQKSTGGDQNSNEPGNESDSTAGEPAGGDETGESAGSQPGEMTDEPKDGSTKPGPGEKPSNDSGDMNSEPRPSDTDPGGEKTPGKKPGEGEATPGKGNETGPTERDPNQDPNAPDAQNPLDRPDDAMQPDGSGDKNSSSQPDGQQSQPGGKTSDSQSKPDGQSPGDEKSAKPSGQQQNSGKSPQNPDQQPPGERPSGPSPDTKTNPERSDSPMSDQPGQDGAPQSPDNQSGKGDSPSQEGGGDSKSSDQGKSDSPGNSPGKGNSPGEGQSDSEGAPSDKPGKGSGKPGKGKGQADPNREGGGASGTQEGMQEGMQEGAGNARGGDGATDGKQNPASSGGEGAGGNKQEPDYSMEDRRKAAELVLNQLEKDLQRGDVDPELLEELGWDKDNLKQFQRRMSDYLRNQNGAEEQSLKQRQFDEMLRNMRLDGKRNAREGQSGGFESPDEFAPNLTPAPPEYRELEEAYKRSLSGAKGK